MQFRRAARIRSRSARPGPNLTSPVRRLFLLAFIWGWSFLLIKVAVRGMTPATVATARMALGASVLLVVVRVKRLVLPRGWEWWRHFVVVALAGSAIPFTPLASGILTGKYRRGEAPPAGTRAGDLPNVGARLTDKNLDAVERLRPWAEARGHTVAELAIAWLLAHPEVSTVIVGARTASQVEANLKAAAWSLTAEERDTVTSLARSGG